MLNLNSGYEALETHGLRTCVAFALICPSQELALLVHFFHPDQIKNNLSNIVKQFLEESKNEPIICHIAGGRSFFSISEDMCELLKKYVQEHLSGSNLKLRLNAPIIAQDDDTFSLLANLKTGDSSVYLTQHISQEEYEVSNDKVDFVNLVSKPQTQINFK